ncbi:long-chain fatty acid transport protein 2-like [Styela clava]
MDRLTSLHYRVTMDFQNILVILASFVALLLITWQLVDYLCPWLKYDIQYLKIGAKAVLLIRKASKMKPTFTIIDKLIDQAKDNARKPFIYYEDEVWSYQRLNEYSNQAARVMYNAGIRMNKTVALLMNSRPEFVGLWFGIGKTGGATAFINYNIRGNSLMHCLKVSECKAIVVSNDPELMKAIEDIADFIKTDEIQLYVLGDLKDEVKFDYEPLNQLLAEQSQTESPLEWRKDLTVKSDFCYVYTSGTTGLPKAAAMKHGRILLASQIILCGGVRHDDIVYSPLPLYHVSSGIMGMLEVLSIGATVVVRKKFSASHFWEECRKYNATFVQYIGETIRYVCDQPPHPDDKNHCVRAIMGNGLRPAVWRKFLDRFGKDIKVVEIYGATEGNTAFFNLDDNFGSVGSFSPLMKAMGLVSLVKYDQENEEIFRDANGRCVPVPYGIPGLMICKITSSTEFHGYLGNKKQTESKILRNVFKDGDSYYNSGDLLRRERDYHMYFVDRVGDTFRWKGENISTNEVADAMGNAPGIKEANVYGVEIPGNEGRAGMAVVLLEKNTELDCIEVYKHVCASLASYARPLFVRIKEELEVTGTFKQKKVKLVKEGCSPENMAGDPIYFMNHKEKCYSLLTKEAYHDILNNTIRM